MDTSHGSASLKIAQPAVEGRQEAPSEWARTRTGPGAVALVEFPRLKAGFAGCLVLAVSMQPPQGRIRSALADGRCLGGRDGLGGRAVAPRVHDPPPTEDKA